MCCTTHKARHVLESWGPHVLKSQQSLTVTHELHHDAQRSSSRMLLELMDSHDTGHVYRDPKGRTLGTFFTNAMHRHINTLEHH